MVKVPRAYTQPGKRKAISTACEKRLPAWLVLLLENVLPVQGRLNPLEIFGNFWKSNVVEARFDFLLE